MIDIRTTLKQAAHDLAASGSPSPRLDAEVLLMHVLGGDRLSLMLHPERELTPGEVVLFGGAMGRRLRGEPVAYILGEKEFWSLTFAVHGAVLIPRPETECLVEEVLKRCGNQSPGVSIIDIGTGSGAIGVVLALEYPEARIAATDVSPGALVVARQNAVAHGVLGRMDFLMGNLFAGASGPFDIIVSNPPYIKDGLYPHLPTGVRDFEPRQALVAGPDGADFHRAIIQEGVCRLKPGGWIFLEIGEDQGSLVGGLYGESGGYEEMSIRKDYAGMDRVVVARRKKSGRRPR